MSLMWRDTGLTIRFLGVDGRAALFFFVALYGFSLIALSVSAVGIVTLFLLERRGYTIPNAVRRAKVLLLPRRRPAVSRRRRTRVDR